MKSVPATLFFKPMNPQPEGEPAPLSEWSRGIASACHDHSPDEDRLNAHTERLRGRIYPFRTKNGGLVSYRQPYRPGEKCYVRETWCRGTIEQADGGDKSYLGDFYVGPGNDVIFKQYCIEHNVGIEDVKWLSPIALSAKYARRFVTILSCEPVQKDDGSWAWRVESEEEK